MKFLRVFRAREGLFRLIPPKPNRFGLALPPKLNVDEIENLFSVGSTVSLFHTLVSRSARTTEFRLYLRAGRFWTWKLVWPGPTYALGPRS